MFVPATAPLAVMVYGEPLTFTVAAAPRLLRLTLAIVSPLTRPLLPSGVLLLNSVPAKVTVWP